MLTTITATEPETCTGPGTQRASGKPAMQKSSTDPGQRTMSLSVTKASNGIKATFKMIAVVKLHIVSTTRK